MNTAIFSSFLTARHTSDSLSIILLNSFLTCEECKPHYIPNIFCLSPQLMRMHTGAEFVRRNVIEMKTKELLKLVLYFKI